MIDSIVEIRSRPNETNFDVDEEMSEEIVDLSFDKRVNFDFFLQKNNDSEEDLNDSDSRYFVKKEMPKEENNTITGNNSSTKTITKKPKNINFSEKIFNIAKINKKIGRLVKKSKKMLQGKHNKFSQDNIIQKIKVNFINSIYQYINKEYENYINGINDNIKKKVIKLIKRISTSQTKKIKKEDNLIWFSLKLKDILSSDLSDKYLNYDKNYNKKIIESLYKKNEAKKLIGILEKSIREMYEIYSKNIKIDGFDTLENDLINLRKKMEKEGEENIDYYLGKYEQTALNLERIFLLKKSRKNKIEKGINNN